MLKADRGEGMNTCKLAACSLLLSSALLTSGCVTITVEGDGQQEAQASASSEEAPQVTGPNSEGGAEDNEFRVTSLTHVKQLCSEIRISDSANVGCSYGRIDGVLTLAVGFKNHDSLKGNLDPVADVVAVPFCNIALENHYDAVVLAVLADEQIGRAYGCESNEWSDWFDISPREPPL